MQIQGASLKVETGEKKGREFVVRKKGNSDMQVYSGF